MVDQRSHVLRLFACLVGAACCLFTGSSPGPAAQPALRRVSALDIATLVDLEALAVSPDGRFAAFQSRVANPSANTYSQSWQVVSVLGGDSRRLADAGDPLLLSVLGRVNGGMYPPQPVWSPDSQWIAYLRKGNGRVQVWRTRLRDGHSEQLTDAEADARALAYSADGRRLLFEMEPSAQQIEAAMRREGLAGFRYDERFYPAYSSHPVLPADIDFAGAVGIGGARLDTDAQANARRIGVFEFANRQVRTASDAEAAEFRSLTSPPTLSGRAGVRGDVVLSRSGAQAWVEARDPAQQGAYAPVTLVAKPAGAAVPFFCSAAVCAGRGVAAIGWRDESEVVFLRDDGALAPHRSLYAWRPGSDEPRLILHTPDLFADASLSKCAVAQDRLVCFYEESDRPRRLVWIDLDSGSVHTLYDPNESFARFNLGERPRRLLFRSPSGGETSGYLVLPPNRRDGERLPLVIVTYLCKGFLRGGIGDEYPVFPYAAQGFAVLCLNLPPHDYSRLATMDWMAYTNWARGEGDPEKRRVQDAVDAAIGRLDSLGVVDPGRVGITGLSFGGETVMYALFHMPHLTAAIASGTEQGPAETFLGGPAAREFVRPFGLATFDSPRWSSLSITRNADRVRAPLLLNVADHEMISSLHPVMALQDANRAVEMYVYPDEYHIKWQPAHRLVIYQRNIDWMNFWLRGVEDSHPSKVSQYDRWRTMRDDQCRRFAGKAPPWYCRAGALRTARQS